jgi:hypothetical protein
MRPATCHGGNPLPRPPPLRREPAALDTVRRRRPTYTPGSVATFTHAVTGGASAAPHFSGPDGVSSDPDAGHRATSNCASPARLPNSSLCASLRELRLTDSNPAWALAWWRRWLGNLVSSMDNRATVGRVDVLCPHAARWFDQLRSRDVSTRISKGPTPPPQAVLPVGSAAAPRTASTRRRADGAKTLTGTLACCPIDGISRQSPRSRCARTPWSMLGWTSRRRQEEDQPNSSPGATAARRQTPPLQVQCHGRDNRLPIAPPFTVPSCLTSPVIGTSAATSPLHSAAHLNHIVTSPCQFVDHPRGDHSQPLSVLLQQDLHSGG